MDGSSDVPRCRVTDGPIRPQAPDFTKLAAVGGAGPAQQGTARLSKLENHVASGGCSLLPPRAGPYCFHHL